MKAIRVNVTFEFNETTTTESEIKERLDALLVENFDPLVVDVSCRWVERLRDSPLFGATLQWDAERRTAIRARRIGLKGA